MLRPQVVVDADRKKSFPNAVFDRYPMLWAVERWVKAPETFARTANVSLDLTKF